MSSFAAGDFGAAPAQHTTPGLPPQPAHGAFGFAAPTPAGFAHPNAFDFSGPSPAPGASAFSPSTLLSTPVSAPKPEAEEGMFGSTVHREAPSGPPKALQIDASEPMRQPLFDFDAPGGGGAAAAASSAPAQAPFGAAAPMPGSSPFEFAAPPPAQPAPAGFGADEDDFGMFSSSADAPPVPAAPAPGPVAGAFGGFASHIPSGAVADSSGGGAFGVPAVFSAPAPSPFAPAHAFPFQPADADTGAAFGSNVAPAATPVGASVETRVKSYGFGFSDEGAAATPFGGFAAGSGLGVAPTPDMSGLAGQPHTPEATLAGPHASLSAESTFSKPRGALDLVRAMLRMLNGAEQGTVRCAPFPR